jgi:hypothetical protein
VDPAYQRQFSFARALPPSLAAQWGRSVDASFSPPLSLSLSRGPGSPVAELLPRSPLSSLSALWACPVSSALHARRGLALAHSRTSSDFSATTPAHAPCSLLRAPSVPRARPRLISRNFALSHALPTPPATAEDPRPCSRPSSSLDTAPSLPELRPKVRHPSPCPISPIAPSVRPISPSPVLGPGGSPCSRGGRTI